MSAAWIIEAIDVFKDGDLDSAPGLPGMSPDQFSFDGFEEGFHRGIIITITFATHRHFEAMQTQDFLIIVRTILAASVRMVDTTPGRPAQGYGHF